MGEMRFFYFKNLREPDVCVCVFLLNVGEVRNLFRNRDERESQKAPRWLVVRRNSETATLGSAWLVCSFRNVRAPWVRVRATTTAGERERERNRGRLLCM